MIKSFASVTKVQNLLWKLLEEQTGTTFEFEQQQQLGNE
jgi:hypothetical protein